MARSVDDFIVDFSKEDDSGGGGTHFDKGYYPVRIALAKTGISENKATPYLELTMVFREGKYAKAKKKVRERLYITPKAMRRFRILLQALGMKVPAKFDAARIAPKLKGKNLVIEIDDEEPREGYEDRPRSRVTFEGFFPEDYEADEDEDEEDEDLEDEDEDEDLEEEDEDEDLEDEDEEDEEEEEPPARKRRAAKPKPKPAARSKTKATASKKRKAKDEDEDEDDDDLEDLNLDDM